MKITRHAQSITHTNPVAGSVAREYAMCDSEIDCALVKVSGQYHGADKFTTNTKVKELLFVVQGQGAIEMKNGERQSFAQYDAILLEAGEVYRFVETDALFCIVCTPPWSLAQTETVD